MADSSTAEPRANLTLRLEGLAAHDELLFKSLVRLLSYRTQHNWTFGTDAVDLRIIGDEALESTARGNTDLDILLWVGHFPADRSPFLQLPLHANELELLLNTLGSKILNRRASSSRGSPSTSAVSPVFSHDEMLMLQRWPSSSLLHRTPARMKLATLMTGHPISINTLVHKSGATLEECSEFCRELDHAGMLLRKGTGSEARPPHGPQEALTVKARPDMSLLARIRRRLGL